jgi:hypothetical protein
MKQGSPDTEWDERERQQVFAGSSALKGFAPFGAI